MVTITLNLNLIGVVLAAYAITGLILLVPLAWWENRFISGNRKWYKGIRWFRAVFAAMVCWPIALGYCIKTEIKYRKKGYL